MYKTVKGIYDNGNLVITEDMLEIQRSEVLVTFLQKDDNTDNKKEKLAILEEDLKDGLEIGFKNIKREDLNSGRLSEKLK